MPPPVPQREYEPCPISGDPIKNVLTAIADPETGRPANFDSVIQRLAEFEELRPNEQICYLGRGSFGILVDQKGKKPRYYQLVAINRTVEAITRGQNRILLVMATGTGKTRVLVEHFLFLLDRRLATATEVVAITYTQKAANELKVRLRRGTLQRERSASRAEDRRYWRRCRLDVERAHVGTCHAFCTGLEVESVMFAPG